MGVAAWVAGAAAATLAAAGVAAAADWAAATLSSMTGIAEVRPSEGALAEGTRSAARCIS
jgi:hypothetical protein